MMAAVATRAPTARCSAIPPVRQTRPPAALAIFDTIPRGMLVHAAGDDSAAPIICGGDVVVIDPTETWPDDGGIYVIAWRSARSSKARGGVEWHIVETYKTDIGLAGWWAGRLRAGGLKDGPFEQFQLADMIVGRVVGLCRPQAQVAVQ